MRRFIRSASGWLRRGQRSPATAPYRRKNILKTFGSEDRGAAAIEFALVAAPFFGFVLFIMQIGLFYFSQQSLDFATRKASRLIMTNSLPAAAKTLNGFKTTQLCPNLLWKMTCDSLVVNAYKVAKTSDATAGTGIYAFVDAQSKKLKDPVSDPTQTTFCLGGPGDYIYLDVAYVFPDFTGGLFPAAGRMFRLRSSSFVYNEPYAGGGSAC